MLMRCLRFAEGKNKEPRTKNQEPRAKNQEPRAKNKEQRTKNKEQRAKNKEQRAKSKEQRTKSKEQRLISLLLAIGFMKINEVPQDEAYMIKGKIRDVCYALDKDGHYTSALSMGWKPKNEAIKLAWEQVYEHTEDTSINLSLNYCQNMLKY
jgi:ATP-dependent 26S proteasome regulatory subunit